MKQFLKRLCISLVVVLVAGAGVVAWRLWPRSTVLLTDAEAIRVPREGAAVRDVLWRPAELLPAFINTQDDDYEAEVSEDGMTLLFVRGRAGGNADIYMCHKSDTGWSEPESLALVNSASDDLGPELSSDGQTLYFYSDREGGAGGYDLWFARRIEDGWREPVNFGSTVNSPYDDYGPALTPDQTAIYFSSNRPREGDPHPSDSDAWNATLREDQHKRDFDLYIAALTDGGPQQVRPLVEVNTPFDEGAATVSPFGDFLYFASNRPGGAGGFDLYRSRRVRGNHESPATLGETINTPANELDPELSLGGYGLHFSSDRKAASGSDERQTSDYDIYYSATREVFREVETHSATIDWAALWRAVGPNLMWGLLALLLLVLLLALTRDAKNRRLSLLARCMFASLMVHMLLMLLFNVWQVGSAVAGVIAGRGKIQISLVSSAVGQQIFSQVRGDFTEIVTPNPAVAALKRTLQDVPSPGVEPIEPVRVTTIEAAPTKWIETSRLEPRAVEDAKLTALTFSPLAPAPAAHPVDDSHAPLDELAIPSESDRETVAEIAMIPAGEVPASDLPAARPSAEAVNSSPSTQRVDLAVSNAAPAMAPDKVLPLSSALAGSASDAPIMTPGLIGDFLSNQPMYVVHADKAGSDSDVALPAGLAGDSRSEVEAPPVETGFFEHGTPPRAEFGVGFDVAPAGAAERVNFEPARSTESLGESATGLLSPVADAPALHASSKAIYGDVTAIQSLPSVSSVELVIGLPKAEAAQSTPSEIESSPLVAAQSGLGLHAAVDVAATSQPAVERSAIDHFAPADSGASDSTSLAAGLDAPADAMVTASAGKSPGDSPIAVVASDFPAVDIALPSDSAGILPPDAVGIIRGRVVDADSKQPLDGALVRLVLPDNRTIEAPSDYGGAYSLYVPPMPDFFALTASRTGYLPKSTNIRADNLSKTPLLVEFELQKQSDPIIALEEEPDVHHLGNDLFEGAINSKFQREAEGRTFISLFQVTQEQLNTDYARAEIRLMARGVQCSHPMRINGRLLRQRLDASPTDGSFGEFAAEFDPAWLIEGENSFKIRAQSCRGDLDDFEFVNIQVRFIP